MGLPQAAGGVQVGMGMAGPPDLRDTEATAHPLFLGRGGHRLGLAGVALLCWE